MMKQGDLMTETKVTLSQRKEWLREVVKTENNERPTVEQDCPKCNNNFTYYTTRQTRSADEGQTVYYECTKCAHTFTENT
jgi:DNA-directed RNA polymerase I subunit RPA12